MYSSVLFPSCDVVSFSTFPARISHVVLLRPSSSSSSMLMFSFPPPSHLSIIFSFLSFPLTLFYFCVIFSSFSLRCCLIFIVPPHLILFCVPLSSPVLTLLPLTSSYPLFYAPPSSSCPSSPLTSLRSISPSGSSPSFPPFLAPPVPFHRIFCSTSHLPFHLLPSPLMPTSRLPSLRLV